MERIETVMRPPWPVRSTFLSRMVTARRDPAPYAAAMKALTRTAFLLPVPLGVLLAAGAAGCEPLPSMFSRTLDTGTVIEAGAERVWQVLVDFEAYPSWNPFVRRLSGELRQGARLEVTVQPAGRGEFSFRPTLVAVEPNRELRWLGHLVIPGLFDGEHGFTIESIAADRVRLRHREVMSGVLVPFLGGMLRDTERGFHEMNRALKARAEP